MVLGCQRKQASAVLRHHFLVGGDDTAAGRQGPLDVVGGGLFSTEQLDDDIAVGGECFVRVICEETLGQCQRTGALKIADENPPEGEGHTGALRAAGGFFGKRASNAATDDTEAEKNDPYLRAPTHGLRRLLDSSHGVLDLLGVGLSAGGIHMIDYCDG